MAKGKKLESSQRGIFFSTISAMEVSVLILIVGAGTFHQDSNEAFSIQMLADLIRSLIGEVGVIIFAVGFVAAALSSMLAVPLGAALTADSLFNRCEEENEECNSSSKEHVKPIIKNTENEEKVSLTRNMPLENENANEFNEEGAQSLAVSNPDLTPSSQLLPSIQDLPSPSSLSLKMEQKEMEKECEREGKKLKTLPRPVYWGIITFMVAVSALVISLDVPRVQIILVAQVFNGCLLPFFAICLILCLNDPQFMSSSPQKGWANIFLLISVTITLFLASNVFIHKLFGHLLDGLVHLKFIVAACVAVGSMLILCVATSLGKNLLQSWRKAPRAPEPEPVQA